jgi:uncharacterized protein (TIGR02266 family)
VTSNDERGLLAPMGLSRPRRPAPRASERRDRVRCEVRIDIDVEGEGGPVACVTRNLSEMGAFLVTELERPLGTELALSLHLGEGGAPIRCTGEVRWVRRNHGSADQPNGFGIRLVRLDPELKRRIQLLLLELAPLDE